VQTFDFVDLSLSLGESGELETIQPDINRSLLSRSGDNLDQIAGGKNGLLKTRKKRKKETSPVEYNMQFCQQRK